ncbi:hypothetical protein [Gloeobacter morelensis]|uniref:Tetratricopeptide repeat protein n=1 Tax=Gloeobacter morelensis MG652769 TaxID=2781736 RepID=A0ABY3PGI2_9CYAN|nr:hypothetical protein [Gloeobacter morelensis]UFP92750.1 hypothetical protein ISF26_12995 [Gloeobacter morelensis MG652769]
MGNAYFDNLITRARSARSPEAIAHLLKPVLLEMGDEFDAYLEQLLAATAAESSTARTLKLIARIWRELQSTNRREMQLRAYTRDLAEAAPDGWPGLLLAGMDLNGPLALTDDEWQTVAALLEKRGEEPSRLAVGLRRGLTLYFQMEANLLDWLYTAGREPLGFVRTGPWGAWAGRLPAGQLRALFEALDRGESAGNFRAADKFDATAWIELTVLLRRIERHLVRSFEQRFANLGEQARLQILTSTFLTFAIFWADFAQAMVRQRALSQASFQNALQILRAFAAQPYFPLYGGLLAVFDGPYLRAALTYLGEPLRADGMAAEKAKVLNLLGYTARLLGDYPRSLALHREALADPDNLTEARVWVAHWVNQGSTHLRLREFDAAVELFERALVYARQSGDLPGQAHALANLGNARTQALQFQEVLDAERYGEAEHYLQQGLELSRRAKERPAEVVALAGLGSLRLLMSRSGEAVALLEQGLTLAGGLADLWWEGTLRAALAEALASVEQPEAAVGQAAAAMLLLERLGVSDWRQPAGLLVVLRNRLDAGFAAALEAAGLSPTTRERVDHLLGKYTDQGSP